MDKWGLGAEIYQNVQTYMEIQFMGQKQSLILSLENSYSRALFKKMTKNKQNVKKGGVDQDFCTVL